MGNKFFKVFQKTTAVLLTAFLTVNTAATAYANEGTLSGAGIAADMEEPYVVQCEQYDFDCGSQTIDGEVVETGELVTLHDGIMQLLDEDTTINTSDYLSDTVITTETNVYSANIYNVNAAVVNLKNAVVAENSISFQAGQVNADGAVVYSKNGDISFSASEMNFTGILYAPNGTVEFRGSNVTVNGVIIAKNVVVNANSFKAAYNASVMEMADTLDYTQMDQMCSLQMNYNDETGETSLVWDENGLISSVDVYARYDAEGFKQIATVTESEYAVDLPADYRIVMRTVYGEELASNIVTLVQDEEGYLYEDTVDTDEDGIPDGYEYLIGTDAGNNDTDGDGYTDDFEVFMLYTNPVTVDADEDFDNDEVTNAEEMTLGTDPYLADSDFDGLSDSEDAEPVKSNVDESLTVDYTVPLQTGGFDLVSKYVDEEGNKCQLIYNYLNGQIKYMSDSSNESFNVYNGNNQLTAAIEVVDGETIANTYSYDGENLETITHNGFQYQFEYDENGNVTDVKVGERTLISNEYTDNQLTSEQYGNGDSNEFRYDEDGNLIAQMISGKPAFTWTYDENGNVTSYRDLTANAEYTYAYDEEGTLEKVESNTGLAIVYTENENTFSVAYTYDGVTKNQNVTETTTEAESVTTTNLISGGKLVSVVSGEESVLRTIYADEKALLSTEYVYSENGIMEIKYQDGKVLAYTYDNANNIESVTENGVLKLSYEYDSLGQLLRENNAYANKTYTYTYDNAGNILESREYAYTTGELGESVSEKTYEYEDDDWKDLLTSFNGQTITYDEIGNPLSYRDGMTFDWQGRQLTSVQYGDNEISYTYNSDGIRTSKTVNDVTTTYQLEGSKIISETTGDVVTWYIYDENDSVIGFERGDATYYFEKNAQGDITRIYGKDGNLVSEYIYDAWGNVVEVLGDKAVAQSNPFRYRGYYQDDETGFYYLQSRYYDAVMGRFISPEPNVYDGRFDKGAGALGYNVYLYCANNVVSFEDSTGQFGTPIQWAMGIIGAVAGWYFGDYAARRWGYSSGWKYWAIRTGIIIGGAVVFWFAGSSIRKMAVAFLKANPRVMGKMPGVVLWLLGMGPIRALSPASVAELIVNAKRVGSAYRKIDIYHRAASYLSESQLAKGTVYYINNGKRILLQVKGQLNGMKGVFEYILDESGNVCHQLFKKGGVINGRPN